MTPVTSANTDTAPVDESAPCHGYFRIGSMVVPTKMNSPTSTSLRDELLSRLWVNASEPFEHAPVHITGPAPATSTNAPVHRGIGLTLGQPVASSTADSIEQELMCENELSRRFAFFVCEAENERFEDGMGSEFATRVHESILDYGPVAVTAWERVLWQMENTNEAGEELLRQFGLLAHHPSLARRLRVLKDSLKSPDSRIRDAASLGLSFLDDFSALTALQSAYSVETEGWLKENMKLVIDQLLDDNDAEIPQSSTSGSLV